ncbi:hypothetical protein HK102_007088, partial [Quaeritorhiza haematococci]
SRQGSQASLCDLRSPSLQRQSSGQSGTRTPTLQRQSSGQSLGKNPIFYPDFFKTGSSCSYTTTLNDLHPRTESAKVKEIKAKWADSQAQVTELQNMLETTRSEAAEERDLLTLQVQQERAEKEAVEKELENAKEQLAKTVSAQQALEETVKSLQSELEKQRTMNDTKIEGLEQQNRGANEKVKTLSSQVTSLNQSLVQSTTKLKQVENLHQQLLTENTRLQQVLQFLEHERSTDQEIFVKQREEMEREMDKLRKQLSVAGNGDKAATEGFSDRSDSDLVQQNSELRRQLIASEEKHIAEQEAFETRCAKLVNEKKQLVSQLRVLEDGHAADHAALEKQKAESEKNVAMLQQQHVAISARLDELVKENRDLRDRLDASEKRQGAEKVVIENQETNAVDHEPSGLKKQQDGVVGVVQLLQDENTQPEGQRRETSLVGDSPRNPEDSKHEVLNLRDSSNPMSLPQNASKSSGQEQPQEQPANDSTFETPREIAPPPLLQSASPVTLTSTETLHHQLVNTVEELKKSLEESETRRAAEQDSFKRRQVEMETELVALRTKFDECYRQGSLTQLVKDGNESGRPKATEVLQDTRTGDVNVALPKEPSQKEAAISREIVLDSAGGIQKPVQDAQQEVRYGAENTTVNVMTVGSQNKPSFIDKDPDREQPSKDTANLTMDFPASEAKWSSQGVVVEKQRAGPLPEKIVVPTSSFSGRSVIEKTVDMLDELAYQSRTSEETAVILRVQNQTYASAELDEGQGGEVETSISLQVGYEKGEDAPIPDSAVVLEPPDVVTRKPSERLLQPIDEDDAGPASPSISEMGGSDLQPLEGLNVTPSKLLQHPTQTTAAVAETYVAGDAAVPERSQVDFGLSSSSKDPVNQSTKDAQAVKIFSDEAELSGKTRSVEPSPNSLRDPPSAEAMVVEDLLTEKISTKKLSRVDSQSPEVLNTAQSESRSYRSIDGQCDCTSPVEAKRTLSVSSETSLEPPAQAQDVVDKPLADDKPAEIGRVDLGGPRVMVASPSPPAPNLHNRPAPEPSAHCLDVVEKRLVDYISVPIGSGDAGAPQVVVTSPSAPALPNRPASGPPAQCRDAVKESLADDMSGATESVDSAAPRIVVASPSAPALPNRPASGPPAQCLDVVKESLADDMSEATESVDSAAPRVVVASPPAPALPNRPASGPPAQCVDAVNEPLADISEATGSVDDGATRAVAASPFAPTFPSRPASGPAQCVDVVKEPLANETTACVHSGAPQVATAPPTPALPDLPAQNAGVEGTSAGQGDSVLETINAEIDASRKEFTQHLSDLASETADHLESVSADYGLESEPPEISGASSDIASTDSPQVASIIRNSTEDDSESQSISLEINFLKALSTQPSHGSPNCSAQDVITENLSTNNEPSLERNEVNLASHVSAQASAVTGVSFISTVVENVSATVRHVTETRRVMTEALLAEPPETASESAPVDSAAHSTAVVPTASRDSLRGALPADECASRSMGVEFDAQTLSKYSLPQDPPTPSQGPDDDNVKTWFTEDGSVSKSGGVDNGSQQIFSSTPTLALKKKHGNETVSESSIYFSIEETARVDSEALNVHETDSAQALETHATKAAETMAKPLSESIVETSGAILQAPESSEAPPTHSRQSSLTSGSNTVKYASAEYSSASVIVAAANNIVFPSTPSQSLPEGFARSGKAVETPFAEVISSTHAVDSDAFANSPKQQPPETISSVESSSTEGASKLKLNSEIPNVVTSSPTKAAQKGPATSASPGIRETCSVDIKLVSIRQVVDLQTPTRSVKPVQSTVTGRSERAEIVSDLSETCTIKSETLSLPAYPSTNPSFSHPPHKVDDFTIIAAKEDSTSGTSGAEGDLLQNLDALLAQGPVDQKSQAAHIVEASSAGAVVISETGSNTRDSKNVSVKPAPKPIRDQLSEGTDVARLTLVDVQSMNESARHELSNANQDAVDEAARHKNDVSENSLVKRGAVSEHVRNVDAAAQICTKLEDTGQSGQCVRCTEKGHTVPARDGSTNQESLERSSIRRDEVATQRMETTIVRVLASQRNVAVDRSGEIESSNEMDQRSSATVTQQSPAKGSFAQLIRKQIADSTVSKVSIGRTDLVRIESSAKDGGEAEAKNRESGSQPNAPVVAQLPTVGQSTTVMNESVTPTKIMEHERRVSRQTEVSDQDSRIAVNRKIIATSRTETQSLETSDHVTTRTSMHVNKQLDQVLDAVEESRISRQPLLPEASKNTSRLTQATKTETFTYTASQNELRVERSSTDVESSAKRQPDETLAVGPESAGQKASRNHHPLLPEESSFSLRDVDEFLATCSDSENRKFLAHQQEDHVIQGQEGAQERGTESQGSDHSDQKQRECSTTQCLENQASMGAQLVEKLAADLRSLKALDTSVTELLSLISNDSKEHSKEKKDEKCQHQTMIVDEELLDLASKVASTIAISTQTSQNFDEYHEEPAVSPMRRLSNAEKLKGSIASLENLFAEARESVSRRNSCTDIEANVPSSQTLQTLNGIAVKFDEFKITKEVECLYKALVERQDLAATMQQKIQRLEAFSDNQIEDIQRLLEDCEALEKNLDFQNSKS